MGTNLSPPPSHHPLVHTSWNMIALSGQIPFWVGQARPNEKLSNPLHPACGPCTKAEETKQGAPSPQPLVVTGDGVTPSTSVTDEVAAGGPAQPEDPEA